MELSEFLGESTTPVEPTSTVETAALETPAQEPATTAEQPVERPRNERGQFVAHEPPTETPHTEERPRVVPYEAMIVERRKRQELEARLAAMETPPEVKDEDFWQSPVEATRKIAGHESANIQSQVRQLRYDLAEDLTRSLHTDYDQVRESFLAKAAAKDPVALVIAMARGHVGAVVVVENDHLIGIFSERDAVFRVVARGLEPTTTPLAEVMTPAPVTIEPDCSFGHAMAVMQEHRCSHLPVVENGRPIGIVSARNALDPELEEFVCEERRRQQYEAG